MTYLYIINIKNYVNNLKNKIKNKLEKEGKIVYNNEVKEEK